MAEVLTAKGPIEWEVQLIMTSQQESGRMELPAEQVICVYCVCFPAVSSVPWRGVCEDEGGVMGVAVSQLCPSSGRSITTTIGALLCYRTSLCSYIRRDNVISHHHTKYITPDYHFLSSVILDTQ